MTPAEVSCRIGTIRMPRGCPLDEDELAGLIEVELGELMRWMSPHCDIVVRVSHLTLSAPTCSVPSDLARRIALEIHHRITGEKTS